MFFLYLMLFITILIFLLIFSEIEINIKNIKFTTYKIKNRHLQEDYKIEVKLYILKFLRIFKLNITKKKLENLKLESTFKNIEKKLLFKDIKLDINIFQVFKQLDLKINELDLKVEVATENAAFTSIIFSIISSALPILLKNQIKDVNKQKVNVMPIFANQNLLNIELNCIFNIKMIHIIYIIYILNKKRRDEKYVRTSNRRTYGYSYE